MHVFYFSLFDQVIDTSSARGGVLECIELSSMVDFSMGTIYLMVGYMTSGHGPLHVPRADLQLTTDKVGRQLLVGQTKEFERAHARRCGLEETSCPRRQAAAEQGRRGTRARWCGNKGRAAPVVRHESERHQCRCARRRPADCWGIQQKKGWRRKLRRRR